jgi:Sulfotransferase family
VPFSDDRLVADGLRDGVERFEVQGPVTRYKHFSLQDYADALGADTLARLFKFTVVRDPWERAISWYFAPLRWTERQPLWSPEKFCDSLSNATRAVDMLSIGERYQTLDMILRFENLVQDTEILSERLNINQVRIPHRNRGLHESDWRKYYIMNPELIEFVADLYGEDAEAFGYRRPSALAS